MRTRKYVLIIGIMISLIGFMSGEARAQKRIGIFMFSEEVRYLESTQGFKERLAETGFGGKKVTYFAKNAGGNKAKAAEMVKEFAAMKLDLILSLGTSATVPLSREIKNVPIVFASVYDPVKAGIVSSWKSSGNNTTGCSPFIPMSKQMESLKKLSLLQKCIHHFEYIISRT